MTKLAALTLATALAGVAAPAFAQSQGDMLLGLGAHSVMPTDDYSQTAAPGTGQLRVDDNIRPTVTFEYFVADNIGLEVLAAWPFEHDIELRGAGDVAKTKHLPPTVSLQYHFTPGPKSMVKPFVGVGVNYTTFFDDKGTGPLAGTPVSLDDSWGLAAHAGIDVAISENGWLRADVRWMDIDTDATVGGTPIGEVEIDPWVVGVAYVHKF